MTSVPRDSNPTLEHLVGARTRGRVIARLFREKDTRLWVREMCRGTGSPSSVRRELETLRDMRMAMMRREGGAAFWTAIEENPLVPVLRELVRVCDELDAGSGCIVPPWRRPRATEPPERHMSCPQQ